MTAGIGDEAVTASTTRRRGGRCADRSTREHGDWGCSRDATNLCPRGDLRTNPPANRRSRVPGYAFSGTYFTSRRSGEGLGRFAHPAGWKVDHPLSVKIT